MGCSGSKFSSGQAVDTALGYTRGFFGLIAEGWDIADTTGKGARGRLPLQAGEVEHLVGQFDSERASGVLWTAEEFNKYTSRQPTDADLQRVRSLRADLFQRWKMVGPGESLVLEFAVISGTPAMETQCWP